QPASRGVAADRGVSQTRLLVFTQQRLPRPGPHADPALVTDAGGHAVRDRRDRLRGFRLWPGPRLLPEGQRGVSSAGCGPIGSEGNRATLKMNGHSIFICLWFSRDKGGISLLFPTYTGIIANVAAGAARQLNLS